MPRSKAKPVAQDGRATKKAVIQKAASRKAVIHEAAAEKEITKKVILAELQKAARELGHTPSCEEFYRLSGISHFKVAWRFKSYGAAIRAAGLKPNKRTVMIEASTMLEDWGNVARKVGGAPSREEYARHGRFSQRCFLRGFQNWSEVPAAFCKFVSTGALAGNWLDVLEKIQHGPIPRWGIGKAWIKQRETLRLTDGAEARRSAAEEGLAGQAMLQQEEENTTTPALPPPLAGKKLVTATMLAVFIAELAPTALEWVTGACFRRRELKDRPLLGAAIQLPGLAHEPVNEMGVILLFGMVARQLGFIVESVQSGFPDCEAKMEIYPGRWQRVRIEFEYESRSFRQHNHDAAQCDLIICWRHNWKGCPPKLQVLELSRMMEQLGGTGTSRVLEKS
jgi:Homing endonuclease associated repeat